MLKPPKYIRGKTLVAIHNVSRYYYHWLFEELPRLLSQDLNNYKFVLTSGPLAKNQRPRIHMKVVSNAAGPIDRNCRIKARIIV